MSGLEHSARQVLPVSAAVKGPLRFTRRQWDQSRQVREVLDSFNHPLRPAPVAVRVDDDAHAESVVMSGADIVITLRTGSQHVRSRFTSAVGGIDAPLALVLGQEPFATVADAGIRGAAAEALAKINTRQQRIARRPIAAPGRSASSVNSGYGSLIVAGLILVAMVVTAWTVLR
jgi:hypothetical protein